MKRKWVLVTKHIIKLAVEKSFELGFKTLDLEP